MSDARTDFFASGGDTAAGGQDARTAFFASGGEPDALAPVAASAPGVEPTWWNAIKGTTEAAGALGAGTLKAITGAANDILPDYPTGSRAKVAAEIAADPILNYRGGPEAAPILNTVGQAFSGVQGQLDDARAAIAAATNQRTADVAGDIATLSPMARGAGKGSRTASEITGTPQPSPQPPVKVAPITATDIPRTKPFEIEDVPGKPGTPMDTEPVEGGLPTKASDTRAEILRRVGLDSARSSALEGNAKNAATDWQLAKSDEPAGVAAKSQFDAERTALQNHSENLVQKTGGTLGTDEDSVNNRGQTIARPFDALSDWFDTQRKALYSAADQRANGGPVTNLEGVDSLLKNPEFRNTLLAKDQGNLLTSIENQLGEFRKQSPLGFSVQGTEQVRQWLNQIWTNDNKSVIGQVKGALDNDVLKGAGEDIYGPARQLVQMKKQTLDNPNGVSQLMEHDPQTPINRTTPYNKIPDTLLRLPPAQFDNVLKTLDTMPEELHPLAQQAKAEIKAHLANKINDAGSSTDGQWNARGVDTVVKANSAKLQSAFADQPDVLQGIQDLQSAGKILKVNQGYPGAAIQAANLIKRGFLSQALSKGAATAGASAGSFLGPLGAAGGAAAGEAIGSRMSAGVSEKAALKQWQKGIRPLGPTTP